jgi:ankyrin repeat protein
MVWQNIVEHGKKMYEEKKQHGFVYSPAKRVESATLNHGYTELHQVAFMGTANERMVVENAPYDNLNIRDHNGNTPLIWAASEGNEQLVEALLDQGALVNMQNFVGETALFLAAARGFDRICALLIENGGDTRLATIDGATPIHMAAACGHLEILKLLTSRGSYVNAVDEEGDCALHYAVREGQRASIELLVKHFGADHNLKNDDDETPLDLAIELGETAIADFLSKFNGTNLTAEPEYRLYFGEENEMHLSKKEQQAQVDEFIRNNTRSMAIF